MIAPDSIVEDGLTNGGGRSLQIRAVVVTARCPAAVCNFCVIVHRISQKFGELNRKQYGIDMTITR